MKHSCRDSYARVFFPFLTCSPRRIGVAGSAQVRAVRVCLCLCVNPLREAGGWDGVSVEGRR